MLSSRRKRRRCDHCNQLLTIPVYKRHKHLFFDERRNLWSQSGTVGSTYSASSDDDSETSGMDEGLNGLQFDSVSMSNGSPGMAENNFNAADFTSSLGDDTRSVSNSAGSNSEVCSEDDLDEIWNVSDSEMSLDFDKADVATSSQNSTEDPSLNHQEVNTVQYRLVRIFLLLILVWSSLHGVTYRALDHLLKLIHFTFRKLAVLYPAFVNILNFFPRSIYKLRKAFSLHSDNFHKYVVCPSCDSVYVFENCYNSHNGTLEPTTCSYIRFPNHPHPSKRKPCGHKLLRKVSLRNGTEKLYPLKVYCYNSIKTSITSIFSRPGVATSCEQWRERRIPPNLLCDVYDGQVWRDFVDRKFLSEPHNLGLMLNIDWFQPFTHTQYSVGVMYLVILNLPRSIRFKSENIIIAGVIPGPKEPSKHINSYLYPLVDDLLDLWHDGITVTTNNEAATYRAALLCVACDLPAAHKVCGFLSHSSSHSCSKCMQIFPYDNANHKIDYSGISLFPPRSHSDQKEHGLDALKAKSLSDQEKIEHEYGARFSELMKLPYFDCVRMTVIDPMHNLFTGTAKHITKNIWLDAFSRLSKSQLESIQNVVDSFSVPLSVGRIPHKIATNMSSFTADQWKNWILYFSLVALHKIIPDDDFECWKSFVNACSCICSPAISVEKAQLSHTFFMDFSSKYEMLYGKSAVTPNIHLHTL